MPPSSPPAVRRKPFVLREPFNGFSHLAGVLLSVIALVVLMSLSQGRLPALVGCSLFGVSLVLVYVASTLYHSLHVSRRIYDWLGRFDYIAIFLLIAGTFAPLCLVTLHGRVGSSVLIAEYSLALIGILGVLVWKKMPDWVRIGLYVAMGLLMVPLLPLLRTLLPAEAI